MTAAGFSYDASGNVTNANLGATFAYDQENFLTSAGTTVSYKVDAQGRRVRKTVGGTVTDYFYFGAVVVAEKQGSTWTDYIFFGGQRIAKQTGNSLSAATFLHGDHLGSIRVATDLGGVSVGSCKYEPFGEVQPGTTCSVPAVYRFAGMEWDPEVSGHGLYHTWFRQYDPSQARWMGVDRLAGTAFNPKSLNRYAYVFSDPVNLIDPSGLCPDSVRACLQAEVPEISDVGCELDGVFVPSCGFILESISGAFVQCPNNSCSRVGADGRPQVYLAFMTGAGYYNIYGPGAAYFSQEAAARAAMKFILRLSIKERREYGGNIYIDASGIYSFTVGPPGNVCGGPVQCLIRIAPGMVPPGTRTVGGWHTHPIADDFNRPDVVDHEIPILVQAMIIFTLEYHFIGTVTGNLHVITRSGIHRILRLGFR